MLFEQIVAGARLLVEAYECGIELRVQGDQLLYRPKQAVTEEFRGRLRDIKPVLLSMLNDSDTDRASKTPMPSGVLSERTPDDAKIDAEFDRFAAIAEPMADGTGWFDPTQEPVPLSGYVVPRPGDRPPGVPPNWSVDGWRKHLLHMADSCERMHAAKAAEYQSQAERLVAAEAGGTD